MGKDKKETNVISLHGKVEEVVAENGQFDDLDVTGEFIVDMLDNLMRIAAKKDRSILVYLLAMARIEAMEMIETPLDD